MNYTDEQKEAIEKRGVNILVSAAAGSGKTAVLVERIIQKIINDKVNVDELLVVTFTNAAALEMKERIIARIEKELENNKEDNFLKEQLIRINKAQISTIDAFCLKVVKENFKELDIEPNFRIGEQNELEILKNTALEEFLESNYEKEEKVFFQVLDAFSKKADDSTFKEIFLNVYEQAQNSIYPEIWLKDACDQYKFENGDELFKSNIFLKMIEYAKEILKDVLDIKDYIDTLLAGEDKIEKIVTFLNDEFNQYKEACYYLQEGNFKGFYESFKEIKFGTLRLTALKENPIKEEIKDLRNKAKTFIVDMQKSFFSKSIEVILEENKKIYVIMDKFCNLIIEFGKYFLDIKKIKNIYTFNDIAHFCLNILISENKPTNIALEYREKFEEIITDEYQDSNLIQEEILSAISKGNNRFMVGDIKQCIYRFRQANPKIFNEKYLGYKSKEIAGDRIDLNANFRSSENVIESINFIFEKIMNSVLGEVEYDEYAKLKKITKNELATDGINISKNCELHIIDTFYESEDEEISEELEQLNNLEKEAHFIARRIKNMVEEENLHILKNGEYVPLTYKDIVILSRGNFFAPVLSKVFEKYKIPIYSKANSGFFQILEVNIILNILKVIDNPLQDIPLISVMYSPIFDFSANELLKIKLKGKSKLFYNCILNYIENDEKEEEILIKINLFLGKIERWSKLSKVISINELLDIIYKESNYYNYVGLLKNGNIRQANLFNLLEKAIAFERTSLHGIFGFISYIEKIKTITDKEGEANIFSEDEDLVRAMTIHKSKGLEFPIVFVSGLSKQFNIMDLKGNILFDPDYKLGVSINIKEENADDFAPRYTVDSIQRQIIKEKIRRDSFSEEVRVLYVALTRAKEKLILTGTNNSKDFLEKLKKMEKTIISSDIIDKKLILPNLFINKIPTYLLWVYSVLKTFENETNWSINLHDANNLFLENFEQDDDFEEKLDFEKLFELEKDKKYSDKYEFINDSLNWEYKYSEDKNLELSLTVSELKRKFQLDFSDEISKNISIDSDDFDDASYNFPKFYKGETEEISALAKGTLYHTVLEHIDLNFDKLEQVDKFINNLEDRGIVTREENLILERDKILMFLKSDFVKRIKKAEFFKREMPFKIGINPSEIYHNEEMEENSTLVLVNGIIDLFFVEDGEIVLVDYKTDKVRSKNILLKRYKTQLDIYKKALESATGRKVKECVLYLILEGKEVRIM